MSQPPKEKNCSLWILAARTDVSFMMQTIPHLVRMCDYPFVERVLAIDTAPPSGEKILRPHTGTLEELRVNCKKLLDSKVVDRIADINFSDEYRKTVYRKHFNNSRIKAAHNWKGAPFLGYIFCIEECRTDYLVHFNNDMLLYQEPDFDWIESGIEILKNNHEIMYVRPQAGPQSENKNIYKNDYRAKWNEANFWRLEGFSSRCFLVERKRFEKLLPIKVSWAKKQGKIKDKLPCKLLEIYNSFSGKGMLESWEIIVANAMKEKTFMRADIGNNKAWTLHPPEHGKDFLEALPKIIEKIEKGQFPPQQAGNYDLQLNDWV